MRCVRGANLNRILTPFVLFIITLQFRCYAHLFFLSLRTKKPDDVACPVDISSLCTLHNIIAAHRLNPKNKDGFNLSTDQAFAKQSHNWNQYQKKYASREEYMKKSNQVEPVFPGKELISLPANNALIGTLEDLSLGTKTSEKRSSITCALLPEQDVEGPPLQFYQLYNKRNVAFKNTVLSKLITLDQLANFQQLVRMDIQFLSSVDVEWQEPEGGGANGAREADSADGEGGPPMAAPPAAPAAAAAVGGGGGGGGGGARAEGLSILQAPQSKDAAAGAIARNEERLIHLALRKSKQDLSLACNVECRGDACCTRADPTPSRPASPPAVYDFSDIVDWDHRRGYFPLTPEALSQMIFDHTKHAVAPKHVFPAAILLFFRAERNDAEEAAFQRLSKAWEFWFDNPLSYDFLKIDPPKRMGLNADEINWCKVRLDVLVDEIKSQSVRERLGLPPINKLRRGREAEAAALLGKRPALSDDGSMQVGDGAGASEKAAVTVDPAPRAAASVVSESAGGSGGGKKRGIKGIGGNERKARQKRSRKVEEQPDDSEEPEAAFAKREKRATEGGSPVKDEDKTTVRASDGKTVSVKDGRIVASGNPLKQHYPNHYRNADNKHDFYGVYLNLGEAFKLACLVHFGPSLPIEQSGHTSIRTALFRTAAYYALSDEEEKGIMGSSWFVDFLFFLVKSAKQLVYGLQVEARLIFGDAVFSRHPPTQKLRGTPCIISFHYAETVFSNPLFAMQSIWAWTPRQPSWTARTGESQGSYRTKADI